MSCMCALVVQIFTFDKAPVHLIFYLFLFFFSCFEEPLQIQSLPGTIIIKNKQKLGMDDYLVSDIKRCRRKGKNEIIQTSKEKKHLQLFQQSVHLFEPI